jgi:CelD/BcsL family acetyltransferase involved in cellulose biosynthesis
MRAVVHVGDVAPLRETWDALYRADPEAMPQASFEWADAWLRHFEPGVTPTIVSVLDGDETVGLAAFAVHTRGPFRLLRGLGEYPADYWDLVAEPSRRAEVAAVAAGELARTPGWDAIAITHLAPGSPMADALAAAGLNSTPPGRIPYPGMELPDTFDGYLGTLPTSRRTNLRRRLRNLDDGEVELREITEVEDVPAAVARWQELRVRQWQEQEKDLEPEHSTPRFGAFVTAAVESLMPLGRVAFWEFRREELLVGSYIGLLTERGYYLYLGGYDPAHAKLGIGKIAIGHGIRTSIDAGRTYYDFMMGAEPYKYWYGATDRFCESHFFSDGRLRSRAAKVAQKLRGR